MALANAMRALGTRIKIFRADFKTAIGDDCGRRALFGMGEIVLVFGERQVTRLGAGGVSKAREHCSGIANHFTFKMFCNFSSGKGHICIFAGCR